jgi:dimethylhistidine N-methyltransferase
MPSRFLYDALGSALFDAICLLPEYGLTRADERILADAAPELMALLAQPPAIAELGAGSGRKTRLLLEAHTASVRYFPIDLSRAALERCALELAPIPGVAVEPIEADYLDGLRQAGAQRTPGRPLLVLFLGSTIGNFERADADDFLRAVRGTLEPGDALLLGTDLVKPVPLMIDAYDDRLGVTAAFNKNLLTRINRELSADFDPARFDHRARWNGRERRIEMRLVARERHVVTIRALGLEVSFDQGEDIWTESSHKYERLEPEAMGRAAGFECARQWTDREWPFAETLLVAR